MTIKDMKLLTADEGKVLVRADGAYGAELCVYAEEADDWTERDKAEFEAELAAAADAEAEEAVEEAETKED